MKMTKFFPISPTADGMRDFRRALTVKAISAVTERDTTQVALRLYSREEGKIVLRGTVVPTSTTNAGGLAGVTVGPFLRSLRPKSAAAQLIELGTRYDLRGGSMNLPNISAEMPIAAWIAEGGPVPVYQGSVTSVNLTPKKLMALSALTNELAEYSAEVAEQIISDLLLTSAGRALDAKMFSADAATAVAPAVLLNGVTATAGTAGGGQVAMLADLRTLTNSVMAAGAGGNLVILASPVQALSMRVLVTGELDTPVIAAPILPVGTVIVLDASAFASGFGADAQIDIAEHALAHFEDTAPQQISTAGAPNTVAAPVRSAFQADFKVLRTILKVAYAMRAPALAYTTTASW